ncbi:MAG: hypothetical protein JXA78_09905 [Anaerolineales bacterium]|nr:hypothetical protein [Anaerolineales bacterium]
MNVLERQERYQEYLYLAEAEGQSERYLEMLARLGRIAEAMSYARQYLATAAEALALAQVLREKGEIDAALESHPEWAIRHCQAQAESIMDGGKSKIYHHAAKWLEKARAAYRAAGQQDKWQTYIEAQIERHYRKYPLRPLLENLRLAP